MESHYIPKRYALLVGIDLYRSDGSRSRDNGQPVSLNWLQGCVNDVNAVEQFLRSSYTITYLSVLSSSTAVAPFDQFAEPPEPVDRLPTFDNIRGEFDAIYNKARAGDFFYFHYSGHGARLKRVSESPPGRMVDPSILTWDYACGKPAVRGWQLNSWLQKLNKKGVHVAVVLDSCHSGGSWRDDSRFRTQRNLETALNLPIDEVAADNFQHEPNHRDSEMEREWSINPDGFTLMAACDVDEKAAEITVNSKSHGAFTYELLNYLEEARSAKRLRTYRMIRDKLAQRVPGQTPRVFGRDRLLFFDQMEPFSTTPLVVRVESGGSVFSSTVILPAGRAHGVRLKSEFRPSPPAPESTFSIDELGDFESKARISPGVVQALRLSQFEVLPSRWSFGDEAFRVLVDPIFGPDFRTSLCETIRNRISSPVEVLERASSDLDITLLRVEKYNDDAKIFGPEDLIGYNGPVRGLSHSATDMGQLVSDVATSLTHLGRFKQILDLRSESPQDQPPFRVLLEPKGLPSGITHVPDGQVFRFQFQNQSQDELFFTVINLGPGFHITQLFPAQDSPQKVDPGRQWSFSFRVTIPKQLHAVGEDVPGTIHRDIIRSVVTKGKELSWKSLEMPDIWNANIVEFKDEFLPARSASLVSEIEWWIQDMEVLQVAQEAVDATPKDYQASPSRLNNLGDKLGDRYSRTGAMIDLDESIRMARKALDAFPVPRPERAAILDFLGIRLGDRYSRTGSMGDLEEAIRVAQEAVDTTPNGHPDRAGYLNNLGIRLSNRYLRTGSISDLDEAIRNTQEAVDGTPKDHPDRAAILNTLGIELRDRYSRTGSIGDLEEAIRVAQEAVDATPKDHPGRAAYLNNLGVRLGERFSRTGTISDLDEAIRVAQEAVNAIPKDHPHRAAILNNLGNRLGDRYSRTGSIGDLEEAIRIAQGAVDATSQGHPDYARHLNNLGNRLGDRYSRTGAICDLKEAIRITQQAVDATPKDHPERAERLNSLGNRLGDRYSRTGAIGDVEEAIRITQQAMDATPKGHPDRTGYLNNLGIRLGERFSRTGTISDLDEAIRVAREAVDATPKDHPDRASRLSNLGVRLGNRYSRTGAMGDLEQAIRVTREAVDATPLGHPGRAGRLNNLGGQLSSGYLQTGAIEDLNEANRVTNEAVDATPAGHPDRAGRLNNLGIQFTDRYSRTGAIEDLDEAIRVTQEAVYATPLDYPDRAGRLNYLGIRFTDRYSRTGAIEDLERAIRVAREAIDTTSSDHPDRFLFLDHLKALVRMQSYHTTLMSDLDRAVSITLSTGATNTHETVTATSEGTTFSHKNKSPSSANTAEESDSDIKWDIGKAIPSNFRMKQVSEWVYEVQQQVVNSSLGQLIAMQLPKRTHSMPHNQSSKITAERHANMAYHYQASESHKSGSLDEPLRRWQSEIGEEGKENLATNLNYKGPLSAPIGNFALEDANRWKGMELQGLGTTLSTMKSTSIIYFVLDLEDFFRCLGDGPLESFLTVTANSPTNAIANTMRQYVTQHWGEAGWDVVCWLAGHYLDTAPSELSLPVPMFLQDDAPNDVPICVKFRGQSSISAPGLPDSQAAYQARWIGGNKTDFDHVIADLTSELAWIVATFKVPHGTVPSFTKAKLEHSIVGEAYQRCIRIMQEEISDEFSNNSKGTCWHRLFSGTNVAVGFPVPSPPERMLGVELPLTLMASLAGVGYPVRYKGGLILKGYSNALIPVYAEFNSNLSKATTALQWHLYSNGIERLYMARVKKEEPELEPLATELDEAPFIEAIELTPRHFLGLYERATVRIGTNASRTDHIRAIPEDNNLNESRKRRLFEWTKTITASLGGGGMGLSGGISTGIRLRPWKERQMRFAPPIPDHSIIRDALTKPIILYDTQTKVAWMLPQIRVVLYLIQAWTREYYQAAHANVEYPAFEEHSTNVGQLLETLEAAWSQFPQIEFKQQFLWYCRAMDGLQDDEDLKPAKGTSNMLAGVDFANLALAPRDYSIFRVPIDRNVSGYWLQMLKSNWKDAKPYRVLTLFCNDLDQAPITPQIWMCNTWLQPPSSQNYLVAPSCCLRTLAERHGMDPVKFSHKHECRQGSSRLLQTCLPGICNPLQKIDRAEGKQYREMTQLLQGHGHRGNHAVLIFGQALPSHFNRSCCPLQPPPQQHHVQAAYQLQHTAIPELPEQPQEGHILSEMDSQLLSQQYEDALPQPIAELS